MVEPAPRFEQLKIALEEPAQGLDAITGVLGVPEWWPTGSRVGIVLAHGAARDCSDPLIEALQHGLTERKFLSLRFNFPFAEAGKRRPDPEPVLQRAFRAAIAVLGRDPTAAPAHLFLGGVGIGGQVAAQVAGGRQRVDGVFALGYPLHSRDDPTKNVRADALFRIVSPLLFVQGTRDRHCDLDALRQTLLRVGAPTALHVLQDADQHFAVPKRSGRSLDEVVGEILDALEGWCQRVLSG